MSNITKLYHWTNVILNPILLIIALTAQSEPLMGVAMGWALISAILNERLRTWVFGYFASLTGGTLVVAIMGALVGGIIFFVVALIAAMVGFFFILAFLWVTSLKAIVDENRGLV